MPVRLQRDKCLFFMESIEQCLLHTQASKSAETYNFSRFSALKMLIKDRLFFSAGQSKFMGSAAFVQLIP